MIIPENPHVSDTSSQSTIDPLHRARAPPPPATRASRSLAQRRVSSTPRVRVSTFVASVSFVAFVASLSLPSLARFRGGSRRLRVPRENRRTTVAPERVDAPSSSTSTTRRRERARGNAEKYQNIAPPSRRPSRPSRGRVGVFVGADRSRAGHGDRPFTDFLGCKIIRSRARADARGGVTRRVDGGERFEATRSEGIGRRRARARRWKRGARARGDGRFRARPETVGFGRAGRRRRAVSDPVRRARGVREACASVRTSIASARATRATRATREGGAPVI